MKKRTLVILMMAGALGLAGCKSSSMSVSGMLGAGQSLASAASLTDDDVRELGVRTSEYQDRNHRVAAAGSPQARRLARLTADWKHIDGIDFDYKVYVAPDVVNAFALPNGSIRFYSGAMEAFSDDELRYVIAHEIGHVVLGHSRRRMQTAYTTSAVRDVAAASGNSVVSAISSSELGEIGEKMVNATFSRSNENEADDFAVDFLRERGLNTSGAVTALRKLESMHGNERSVFSSHPAPGDRAKRMETRIARN